MSAVAKNLKKRLWAQLFPHRAYDDCLDYDDFKLAVEDALKQGVDLIVTISPTQIACLFASGACTSSMCLYQLFCEFVAQCRKNV